MTIHLARLQSADPPRPPRPKTWTVHYGPAEPAARSKTMPTEDQMPAVIHKISGPRIVEASASQRRQVSGLASAWAVDLSGDAIKPGAYSKWLREWRAGGDPVPLKDSHRRDSSLHNFGVLVDAEETKDGLLTTFEIIDQPSGNEFLERIRAGVVHGLSIGYVPIRSSEPTSADRAKGVRRVLEELALREISLTDSPMNPHCQITHVAGGKAMLPWVREKLDRQVRELRKRITVENGGGMPVDDPKRLASESTLRELKIRRLRSALPA